MERTQFFWKWRWISTGVPCSDPWSHPYRALGGSSDTWIILLSRWLRYERPCCTHGSQWLLKRWRYSYRACLDDWDTWWLTEHTIPDIHLKKQTKPDPLKCPLWCKILVQNSDRVNLRYVCELTEILCAVAVIRQSHSIELASSVCKYEPIFFTVFALAQG